jgi:acetylornithine deacetylase
VDQITTTIKKEVAKNRQYLIDLISKLVQFGSYSGESEEIQLYIREIMAGLALETELVKVEPEKLSRYKGFSDDGYPYERRYSLMGTLRAGKSGSINPGHSLILNGHVDIVPPGDLSLWTEDPLSGCCRDNKIFGRGSLDMKGGLSAAITAVKVLRNLGFANYGDLILTSVCGEETGGCGAFALINTGLTADGCIILEPTKLNICPVQSGCHTFKITVKGRSIHACMAYRGINVIDKFYLIYKALKEMDLYRHARYNNSLYENPANVAPFSVGIVEAGEWPSSVPDRLETHGRMGIFPGETVEEMHREFEETVQKAAAGDPWLKDHPPLVEWYEGLFEPADTPSDSEFVSTLADCHIQALKRKARLEAVTYGSDLRIFRLYGGIPTVLYGPGDVTRAHTVNEYITVDEVMEAVVSIALMIVRWCGGKINV